MKQQQQQQQSSAISNSTKFYAKRVSRGVLWLSRRNRVGCCRFSKKKALLLAPHNVKCQIKVARNTTHGIDTSSQFGYLRASRQTWLYVQRHSLGGGGAVEHILDHNSQTAHNREMFQGRSVAIFIIVRSIPKNKNKSSHFFKRQTIIFKWYFVGFLNVALGWNGRPGDFWLRFAGYNLCIT